jgi:hypothetical protein
MRCTAQPGSYSSAGVSPETKLFAALLAVALKPLGVTIPQFASAASSTLYQVTKWSLQRHVAAVERGDNPFTDEKRVGAAQHSHMISGWWFPVLFLLTQKTFPIAGSAHGYGSTLV